MPSDGPTPPPYAAFDPDPKGFDIDRDTATHTYGGDGVTGRSFERVEQGTKQAASLAVLASADEPLTRRELLTLADDYGVDVSDGELTALWARGVVERSAAQRYGESGVARLWWVNSYGLATVVDHAVAAASERYGGNY